MCVCERERERERGLVKQTIFCMNYCYFSHRLSVAYFIFDLAANFTHPHPQKKKEEKKEETNSIKRSV